MAESSNGGDSGSAVPHTKRCFCISEFGADEAARVERKQTLKHLVRKVLEPLGYEVQRADDIDDMGQITHQIIERLLDDDLVVADLTGLNPNVFYELAVRHAARKPVVTLMTFGETLPFDLKDVRTVFYDLHDPDKLEAAQAELKLKVKATEQNPADIRNPITVARDVSLLQESDDPETQERGAVLSAVNELKDEVRALSRQRAAEPSATHDPAPREARRIGELIHSLDDFTLEDAISRINAPPAWIERQLEDRVEAGDLHRLRNGMYSKLPF